MKELPLFVSWWMALVPGGFAAAVTLVVLIVRAAAEDRPATVADVVSALAVGLIVGVVSAFVPFLMMRRVGHDASAAVEFHVGPASSAEVAFDRFQKFDDSARLVLTNAQREAVDLNHAYFGTEHLLLGILRDRSSVAARTLGELGVDAAKAREFVELTVGRGDAPVSGEMPLTPRSKRVIELAIDEARRLHDDFVGSEHLLLGLVREGEGIGAGVLELFGVEVDQVRQKIARARHARDDDPA
jgi:hypothetical protein